MSLTIRSLSDLFDQIRRLSPGLIAVDGYHGAGKSTLTRILSASLGIRCVHLDAFLVPNQGNYVSSLKLSELSATLQEHPVLVEGVCLMAVMERLCVKP